MQDAPTTAPIDALPSADEAAVRGSGSFMQRWWRTLALAVIALVIVLTAIRRSGDSAIVTPAPQPNPLASDHLPWFVSTPGSSDILLNVVAVVLVGAVLFAGVLFFWLHSLPERLVHNSSKLHVDLVAILALLSLFTHIHAFWIAALLLTFVKVPNLSTSFAGRAMERVATSLEDIAEQQKAGDGWRKPSETAKTAEQPHRLPR